MPSLSELRRKVKSIKSTQQITRVMKMIAGARLSRAQKQMGNARYFSDNIRRLICEMTQGMQSLREGEPVNEGKNQPVHPLLKGSDSNRVCLVVISGDKGLCGGFNHNIIRKSMEFLQGNTDKSISLFVVGRKAQDYFRRQGIEVMSEYANFFGKLNFDEARNIARDLAWYYIDDNVSEMFFIYNELKSIIKQEVVQEKVLPIDTAGAQEEGHVFDYIYEPEKEKLLPVLLFKYVAYKVYAILSESYAAELAARMTAMDQASKNAHELIDSLTLEMNKVRQADITRELADIVGASEVLR